MNLCVQIGVALDSAPCFGVLTAGSRCISPYGSIEIPAEYFGLDRARKKYFCQSTKIQGSNKDLYGDSNTDLEKHFHSSSSFVFFPICYHGAGADFNDIFMKKSLTAAGVSGILSEKTKKAGCIRLTSRPWQRGQQQLFPWFPHAGGRVVARMHGAFAFFY